MSNKYCLNDNGLWEKQLLHHTTLVPLRRVVNAVVPFVALLGPRDHPSDAQRGLHLLPIEQRITYKLCLQALRRNRSHTGIHLRHVIQVSEYEGRAHLRSAIWNCMTYYTYKNHYGF